MWGIAVVTIITCLWFLLRWSLGYWRRRGIDGPSPLPLVGNMLEYIMSKKHFGLVYTDIYRAYPKAKYVGIHKFTSPTLLIRDLDVVHDVLIGKVSSFGQNEFFVNEKIDPLLAKSPFVQTGVQWKETRSMLTPIFTLARVKQLLPIVDESVRKLSSFIRAHIDTDLEAKNLCFKFAMENVASCAFGLNAGCFDDPDNSEFFINGSNVFEPNFLFNITTLFFPGLTYFVKTPAISPRMDTWLRCIIKKVVEEREKESEQRNDFLQLLLNLQAKNIQSYDEEMVVGHCLTFLTEGTETSSITMTYALYELAKNPCIQEILLGEINELTNHGKSSLTADLLQEMHFLNQVISETLRMHPPVLSLNKICMKKSELVPQYENGKTKLIVEPGTRLLIPVYAIFRDPSNFKSPDTFDPDRYSKENAKDIPKMVNLAFGEGPRICLGKIFALFQIKLAIVALVKEFKISLSSKMRNTPKISAKAFLLHADEGIWLSFQKRK